MTGKVIPTSHHCLKVQVRGRRNRFKREPKINNLHQVRVPREQEKKREQIMQGRVFDSLTNKQFGEIKAFLIQEVNASSISYDVNGMVQDMVAALNSNDKESFLKAALMILQTLKVANGI